MLRNLKAQLDDAEFAVLSGSCLNAESMEQTSLMYATEIGRIEILNGIVNYEPQQVEEGTDE